MSDEELEEYINKIEPNFDSHLEKGTIEMSIEYYNLLEEKMVRLINKNQELENQQKEFTEYLENYLKLFDNNDVYEEGSYDTIEEILSKYKEIIGYVNE